VRLPILVQGTEIMATVYRHKFGKRKTVKKLARGAVEFRLTRNDWLSVIVKDIDDQGTETEHEIRLDRAELQRLATASSQALN